MVQHNTSESSRSGLRDLLRVLRRRSGLILACVVVAVALALAYAENQPPSYQASADILLAPTTFDVQRTGATITTEEVATQVQVVTSRPVAEGVKADLGLSYVPALDNDVTVAALGTSRVLRITATSSDPQFAADLAEAVAKSYLSYRRASAQASLTEVSASLTDRQQRIESRINRIDGVLRRDPNGNGRLEAERRNLLSQLGQITSQLASLDLNVSSGAGGDILTNAERPSTPVSPRPAVDAVLALLLGLLAGVVVALLRERLDDVLYNEDALRTNAAQLPVLGRIPSWRRAGDGWITVDKPDSPASQAFQTLSARLRHVGLTDGDAAAGMVVVCTAAQPGEGKTVVAANLARATARVGLRVILADADLRRHRKEPFRGVDHDGPGLFQLLNGEAHLDDCLVDGPASGVQILPAGQPEGDPTQLLASDQMRAVVRTLAKRADLVVLETPPVLNYADSLELVSLADVTLLVVRIGRSRVRAVAAAAGRLHRSGGDALATVVLGAKDLGYDGDIEAIGRSQRHRHRGLAV